MLKQTYLLTLVTCTEENVLMSMLMSDERYVRTLSIKKNVLGALIVAHLANSSGSYFDCVELEIDVAVGAMSSCHLC